MKYFKLINPVAGTDVGNVSSQIESIIINSNPPLYDIDFSQKIKQLEGTLVFKLESAAILSDFISTGILQRNCMIVSPKAKNLLINFNLGHYDIFNIKIQSRKAQFDYFLFQFYSPKGDNQYIDFQNTEFSFEPDIYHIPNGSQIKFKDFEDYSDTLKTNYFNKVLGSYRVKKIAILESRISTDIFYFGLISAGIYVSEKLKQAILHSKLTGIRFVRVEDISEPLPLFN